MYKKNMMVICSPPVLWLPEFRWNDHGGEILCENRWNIPTHMSSGQQIQLFFTTTLDHKFQWITQQKAGWVGLWNSRQPTRLPRLLGPADAKNAFNDFVVSRIPDFYAIWIERLVFHSQYCVNFNSSNIDY